MWRDRFSAHTTPSRSPAPQPSSRNSLQVERPSLTARNPSLSALSNPSSTSLASGSKPQSSPGPKIRVGIVPPHDVEDPLTALERLVGSALEKTRSVTHGNGAAVEPITDIDFGGKSLQEFVQNTESAFETVRAPSSRAQQSVEEYEQERGRYETLHSSILECDEVLKSVENYLGNFQADLGAVSAEIEHLQTRSSTLNARLENRKNVEKILGPVVSQIALSPAVVRKITDGAIDESWVTALEELENKEKFIEAEAAEHRDSRAVQDLKPVVEDLANKAVERVRDYFGSRVKSLRLANVHAGVVQKHDFLRFKSLFAFLARRQPQLAEDLNQAYSNGMRFYYSNHFTRYRDALAKLKVEVVDSRNMLGDEPSARTGAAGGSASKPAAVDPFNIGRRGEIAKTPSNTAIPASIAEESSQTTNLETPFYSYNLSLVDNASSEFTFLSSFLPSPLFGPARVARQFLYIFAPTFEAGQAFTKSLTSESFDAIGLLLAVRLTQHFAFKLQRRRVPTMDGYVNGTSMLLWPRFQQIMDAHCESLKRLTASLPSRPGAGGAASAAFATLAGGGAPAATLSTAPHRVTQRFANLLRGILVLSTETRDDEPVANSVSRLREAYDAFIMKMRLGFGSGEKGRKERDRFMASNYGLITAVIEGPDVTGRLAEDCRAHFEGSRGTS